MPDSSFPLGKTFGPLKLETNPAWDSFQSNEVEKLGHCVRVLQHTHTHAPNKNLTQLPPKNRTHREADVIFIPPGLPSKH